MIPRVSYVGFNMRRYRKKFSLSFLDKDNKLKLLSVDFNCDSYCILIYSNRFESVIGTQGQLIKEKFIVAIKNFCIPKLLTYPGFKFQ